MVLSEIRTSPKKKKTVILRTGYAPPEQYLATGKLGPWTDVYAVCATISFMITGISPVDAMQVENPELLTGFHQNVLIEPYIQNILSKGMMFRISDRISDMTELYLALAGKEDHSAKKTMFFSADTDPKTELDANILPKKKKNIMFWGISSALTFGLVLFSVLYTTSWHSPQKQESSKPKSSPKAIAQTSPVVPSPTATAILQTPRPIATQNPLLSMPDLTGKTVKTAKKKIKALKAGITVKVSYQYSQTVKKKIVLSQSIAEGISFTKGTIKNILLTASLGKKKTKTPATKEPDSPAATPKKQVTKTAPSKKPASPAPKKKADDSFSYSTPKPYADFTLE